MARASAFLSRSTLLALWETRVGHALQAVGLGSVRTTILTLAVLATLIPALATSCISYRQNRRAIQATTNEQLAGLSGQAAREMGLWLKERLYDLRVFAASYEVTENLERGGGTSRRLPDYLGSVKDRFPDYDELLVVGPDQRTVASSAAQPGRLHFTGDWLAQARVGDAVLGDPSRADSAPASMEVAVPITSPTGRFLGVLGARLNFAGIEQLLDSLAESSTGQRLAIVQQDGHVVADVGGTLDTVPEPVLRRLQLAEATSVSYRSADGVSVVGALRPVPGTDWSAVAEVPSSFAFAEIRRMRNATALLVLLLLLAVGSLAYGLGLLIVRPLERLSTAAKRVAGGDLEVDVPAAGGGELSTLAGVFNDMVRRLREGRSELERLSVTDELTGLSNRRRLMAELDREVRRSDRHGHPFTVLMLDVDRFKIFNDAFGHPAGDAVLKRLAKTLRDSTRDVDTVARYGGEEFMVILPETPAAEASRVAERIRSRTEADKFRPGDGIVELSITVSIGYAIFPDHAKAPETLIEAADQALYRSKAAGRNKVTVAETRKPARPTARKAGR